jgi:hypothetical protein
VFVLCRSHSLSQLREFGCRSPESFEVFKLGCVDASVFAYNLKTVTLFFTKPNFVQQSFRKGGVFQPASCANVLLHLLE